MQAVYNPQVQQTQYYQQVYGASSSNPMGASPYYYGYSLQAPTPRGAYPAPHQPQRLTPPAPSYLYYSSQLPDATAAASFPPPPHPFQLTRHPFPSPSSGKYYYDTLTINIFFSALPSSCIYNTYIFFRKVYIYTLHV